MNKYVILSIFLFSAFMLGIPSCSDDCSDDSVNYRIDNYSLKTGKLYRSGYGFVFEESDSVHISEFNLQIKADSLIEVGKFLKNTGGFLNTAIACSPAFTHDNPISKLKITASDTLIFQRLELLPGSDITPYLTSGSHPPVYAFNEFNKAYNIQFSIIPSRDFYGKFHFEIITFFYGDHEIITGESEMVIIYF